MTVARYVADRAQRHKPATLMRRIVGIGRAHARRGLPDPTKSELVRAVLQGVRRERGGPQRRAQPLLPCDLRRMLGQLALDRRGLRDRALVLLGFAAALRRSELVSLDVDDLTFMPEGMTVRVRRSKTDQVGAGRSVAVPLGQGEFCAVAAVQAWLSGAQLTSGPIFRSVSRAGSVSRERLSDQSVSLIVKALVAAIGLPPAAYSGHSLRAGLVTSAALMGVPAARIQQQTGHQSVAMMSRYVRDARPFEENAAGAVL
jgi:integrase